MAFKKIGTPRRRYPRQVAVPDAELSVEPRADVIRLQPADDEFFCAGCRRDLPLTDQSRIVRTRCMACA